MKLPRHLFYAFALLPFWSQPIATAANLSHIPMTVPVASTSELAQFTLQLGVPDRRVVRALNERGYREVTIVYRGLTKSRAEACKNGVKFSMEITPRGRIKALRKIGDCRKPITSAQAADQLERKGYRSIRVEQDELGEFTAFACQEGVRYEISLNQYGDVGERHRRGWCRDGLSAQDVRARLRSQGYNRIEIRDRGARRYVVRACRKRRRVELRISLSGEIRRTRRIGRCSPPIKPSQIASILSKRGLNRIEVVDRKPPRYMAEACWGTNRVRIILSRYGETIKERQIGKCPPPVTKEQVSESMSKQGFKSIVFVDHRGSGFIVNACLEGNQQRLTINRYGETMDEESKGRCPSPRLEQVIQKFKGRGLSNIAIILEACRGKRRIEFKLDEYGTVIERNRRGKCRN